MIGRPAIGEIMMVVGDQVGVDAMLFHDLRKGVVKGLQRSPAAMQEMAATGMQIAACRHAGQAADIMIVKGDRPLLEPGEIRCMDRLRAIGFHGIAVE